MIHIRTNLRNLIRAALVVALPDVKWPADHWTKVSSDGLPRGGIATPRTATKRHDVQMVERSIDLVVVLKRAGGKATDDDLDVDSAAIEQAVLGVFAGLSDDFDLLEEQISVDAAGSEPIGELSMLFRVTVTTDEGNSNTI